MQPQEWVRAEPWRAGPGLMAAMGLGANGGQDGAEVGGTKPVSHGEPPSEASSEDPVSREQVAASHTEPVSRGSADSEVLNGGEEPVSRGEAEPSDASGEEPVSRGEAEPSNASGEELVSREDPAAAERAGSEAMWRSVIGERSEAVGRMAAVQAPKGVRLRPRPNLGGTGDTDLGILPFGEAVHVQRRTEHGWCWVVVVGNGAAGFVEQHFLAMNPPDPGARLLLVKPGDKLHEVVSRHYQVREGNDARLYVQAIVAANRGRRGVYLEEGELDDLEEAVRTESAERTVATYRGAKVRKGHAIWLPNESFVAALRSLGAIGSGESVPNAVWRGAKAMAGAALDEARYAAAFTIGLLEGGFGAVVDLFSGAAELVQAVAQVALEVVTGDGAALVAMARGWVSKLQKVWENRDAIAEDFLRKWESEDAWTRGNFQGEVLGWVMMTALLCIATAGAGALSAAGQISGRWAAILRALAAIDALGDLTTYVGAAARLPAKAASHLRGKLGVSGEVVPSTSAAPPTTGGWEDLGESLDEPAHAGGRQPAGHGADEARANGTSAGESTKRVEVLPKSWRNFDPQHNEAFLERLRAFRGNDLLKEDFSGGEGRIFAADGKETVLKRWYSKRLRDLDQSVAKLEEMQQELTRFPHLQKDITVVRVHERGPDWIVRDFDANSLELKAAGAEAQAARVRLVQELEKLSLQSPGGKLAGELGGLLAKLRREPPSANLHWSPSLQKILIIDLQ